MRRRSNMADSDDKTDEIARVGKAGNPQEAQIWRQILEENGIRSQVVGEHLAQLFGAIPPSYPEVWVNRSDLERARALIAQYRARAKLPQQDLGEEPDHEQGDEQ